MRLPEVVRRLPVSSRVLTFLAVGGAGYVVDVVAFNLLRSTATLGSWDPSVARVLAVAVAMVVTYLGNSLFTWRGETDGDRRREVGLFVVFNLVGLGISVVTLTISHDLLGLTSRLADNISANVVGLALGTWFRYWSYSTFVFAPTRADPSPDVTVLGLDRAVVHRATVDTPAWPGEPSSRTSGDSLPARRGERRMQRTRMFATGVATALVAALSLTGGASDATGGSGYPPKPPKPPEPASRVLIVLFDQMLPQYADQFRMPHFRKVRDAGVNYDKAYLGYMASETVIAHNVIPSGLLPKNMGYTDEAYRDHGNVFGKGVDQMHITGDLSLDDFAAIQKNHGKPYPKLADYLHAAHPGTKFITVGEKSYAVETATGASGDIAVRLSGRKKDVTSDFPTGCRNLSIPGVPGNGSWRGPQGKAVPAYLTQPDPDDPKLCGRFYINSDSANDYGTAAAFPSWLYPSDGNRYWPGSDPKHRGGDTWVADAAIAMMKHENWSGMFVTMGAIDKAAHMWGAQADVAPKSCTTLAEQTHVKCAAENADRQLGKLLDQVKKVDAQRGGKTLVVLTADHGATYGKTFLGKQTSGAGDSNWYYAPPELGVWDAGSGATAPDTETYSDPSDAVKNILDSDGNVQFSYQSTAIETWLIDHSTAKKKAKASTMLQMPGVIASYWRNGDHFVLRGTRSMTSSEKAWWKAHGQEIVDTMAAPDGPDVVGLLHDRTSYGVYGDHGGAQQTVQRVPMVFWTPGIHDRSTGERFRTPDVLPTILKAMGIQQTSPTDGKAHALN